MERRKFISTTGVGVLTALVGCEDRLPEIQDVTAPELPNFINGWAEIREDLDVEVMLQFDGEIQERIDENDINGDDLFPPDEDTDVELKLFESRAFEPFILDFAPDVPPDNTVKGILGNFVRKQEASEDGFPAPWYSTGLVHVSDEIDIDDNASFTVRFPSGYTYHLPIVHDRFDSDRPLPRGARVPLAEVSNDMNRTHAGLFDYSEYDPDRSIPHIYHFDYGPLVTLRASAEYRIQLISEIGPLYDWKHEYYNGVDELVQGINEISEELVLASLEGIVTSALPRSASSAVDIYSLHDAFTTEFSHIQDAADSMSELILATQNESWMNFVHEALIALFDNSREAYDRNIILTTENDLDEFKKHLGRYETRLKGDKQGLETEVNQEYWNIRPTGGEYWESLHTMGYEVMQEIHDVVSTELNAVTELRTELT